MNPNAEGLNYFPFLAHQQSPPSSSRTMPSPCGGGVVSFSTGGQTTRRSLPKNLHGNYEGDFSMFTSRNNQASSSLMDQILEAGLDLRLDQHFATTAAEEQLDDDADEMVEEEIRAKMAEIHKPQVETKLSKAPPQTPKQSTKSPQPNLWQRYKRKLLNDAQCKRIDDALDAMQQNSVLRKMSSGCKFAALMISCVLRLLLLNVVMRAVNVGWSAARCRNMLRKGSRRLLWCMTLAKCGDVQLFGLVLLLSPLVFLAAVLGFVFALYCVLKHGIQSFVRHLRYIEFEVPQAED